MTYAVKAVRLFVFSRRCVARTKVHGVAKGKNLNDFNNTKMLFLVHADMIVADIAGEKTPPKRRVLLIFLQSRFFHSPCVYDEPSKFFSSY